MSPRVIHFGHSCQHVHEERSTNPGVNDACQDKLSVRGGGEEAGRGRERKGERGEEVTKVSRQLKQLKTSPLQADEDQVCTLQ